MANKIVYSEKFKKLAECGSEMNYMRALYWLSDAYIKHFEDLKFSTLIYRAADGWRTQLIKSGNHPLKINAVCRPLMELLPHINPNFTPDYFPGYLTDVPDEELYGLCESIIKDKDDAEDDEFCKALCAGIQIVIDNNLPFDNYRFFDITFDTDYETWYVGYVFKSKQPLTVNLHIFRNTRIMSEFHFVVDFLKFLASNELHLISQRDEKKQLLLKGKQCSWSGYELIAKCFKNRFLDQCPSDNMTFRYTHEIDKRVYKWSGLTLLQMMERRGLVPHYKYKKFIERSHDLIIKE